MSDATRRRRRPGAGGCSNSHPALTFGHTRIERAGIDTWSPGWYVDESSEVAAALQERATVRSARGSMLLPEPIAGHRVGWFPGTRLAFAEGHPAGEEGLAMPSELPRRLEALEAAMRDAGLAVPVNERRFDHLTSPGRAGLRRLDATVDLRVERHFGLALLDAIAAHDVPRCKRAVYLARGRVETVAWHGYAGGKLLARVYDKGLETGQARPGELIRLEDQRRFQAGRRPPADELGPATVHELFRRRFGTLAAAGTVTMGGVEALASRVEELVAAGELTRRRGRTILGNLAMAAAGVSVPSSTARRHRAQLRDLGLLLVRDQARRDRVDVELGPLFSAVLGADVWQTIVRDAAAA